MVFKMEDSGFPCPRNSGLVRALGGHPGSERECGRRADPEPPEREGPWVRRKLFGTSSRALEQGLQSPLPTAPRENTCCCLSCSVGTGRVGGVDIPPPGTSAKCAFVYLRFGPKKKKKACLLKNTAPENSLGCGDLGRSQGTFLGLC